MMPEGCSVTAPDCACEMCEKGLARIIIRGWPVCDDSRCKMDAWEKSEQGPVKIERHEQD